MNPLTDQEVAAELAGREPYLNVDGVWIWCHSPNLVDLPQCVSASAFARLTAPALETDAAVVYRAYPTAEAAYADLAQAIRAAHEVRQ